MSTEAASTTQYLKNLTNQDIDKLLDFRATVVDQQFDIDCLFKYGSNDEIAIQVPDEEPDISNLMELAEDNVRRLSHNILQPQASKKVSPTTKFGKIFQRRSSVSEVKVMKRRNSDIPIAGVQIADVIERKHKISHSDGDSRDIDIILTEMPYLNESFMKGITEDESNLGDIDHLLENKISTSIEILSSTLTSTTPPRKSIPKPEVQSKRPSISFDTKRASISFIERTELFGGMSHEPTNRARAPILSDTSFQDIDDMIFSLLGLNESINSVAVIPAEIVKSTETIQQKRFSVKSLSFWPSGEKKARSVNQIASTPQKQRTRIYSDPLPTDLSIPITDFKSEIKQKGTQDIESLVMIGDKIHSSNTISIEKVSIASGADISDLVLIGNGDMKQVLTKSLNALSENKKRPLNIVENKILSNVVSSRPRAYSDIVDVLLIGEKKIKINDKAELKAASSGKVQGLEPIKMNDPMSYSKGSIKGKDYDEIIEKGEALLPLQNVFGRSSVGKESENRVSESASQKFASVDSTAVMDQEGQSGGAIQVVDARVEKSF